MIRNIKSFFKKNEVVYKITKEIYFSILIFRDWFERVLFSPFLLLRVNNNKIIFSSYFGKGFGDNPGEINRYMYEYYGDEFKYFWVVESKEVEKSLPEYITPVRLGSAKYYYHMSTSRFWVDNCRKNRYPFKRKIQTYIQTWHGGIAFKRIEKDAEKELPSYYIYNAKKDSKIVDVMTSNSKFQTEMIRRAFWYNGEIIKVGSPRLDKVLDKEESLLMSKRLKSTFQIKNNKKVMLYAPTFRNSKSMDSYIKNYNDILEALGDEYVILVRLHPNISGEKLNFQCNNRIINVSNYPDIYDLFSISDLLVTDYSSSMFEFSFMNKPVFLYVTDFEEYSKERGTYFKMEELPFSISSEEKDLVNNIKRFDHNDYFTKTKEFFDELDVFEKGIASKFIVERIVKELNYE